MALKTRYTVVNGEILSENRSGTIRDYVPDPLGSTVALLDNTQAQQSTFSYWPYGEVKTSSGPTSTPFQYVGTLGYFRDSASKEYVRARYLDTQKGRWLTQDPIGFEGGDYNLYRYFGNDPTTGVSPSYGVGPSGSGNSQKGVQPEMRNELRSLQVPNAATLSAPRQPTKQVIKPTRCRDYKDQKGKHSWKDCSRKDTQAIKFCTKECVDHGGAAYCCCSKVKGVESVVASCNDGATAGPS